VPSNTSITLPVITAGDARASCRVAKSPPGPTVKLGLSHASGTTVVDVGVPVLVLRVELTDDETELETEGVVDVVVVLVERVVLNVLLNVVDLGLWPL